MMSLTSTAWMEWLRRSRQAPRVRKVRARDVPAEAIAIAIVVVAVAVVPVAAQAAVREVTVVATPAAVAADAEEGKSSNQLPAIWRAAGMRPFFLCLETMAS